MLPGVLHAGVSHVQNELSNCIMLMEQWEIHPSTFIATPAMPHLCQRAGSPLPQSQERTALSVGQEKQWHKKYVKFSQREGREKVG